jgi:hypothetical protein
MQIAQLQAPADLALPVDLSCDHRIDPITIEKNRELSFCCTPPRVPIKLAKNEYDKPINSGARVHDDAQGQIASPGARSLYPRKR